MQSVATIFKSDVIIVFPIAVLGYLEILGEYGVSLFLLGAVMTILPMIIGYSLALIMVMGLLQNPKIVRQNL